MGGKLQSNLMKSLVLAVVCSTLLPLVCQWALKLAWQVKVRQAGEELFNAMLAIFGDKVIEQTVMCALDMRHNTQPDGSWPLPHFL